MNTENEIERDEREIEVPSSASLVKDSDIDKQITTAHAYPRSISQFRKSALEMVTLTKEIAAACIYALPRRQWDEERQKYIVKPIEGPSARFAEIIFSAWKNSRSAARPVGEDEEFVYSQGVFFDLESNTSVAFEVKRRITDKNGNRYNADMIGVTANAASSIAMRNAILRGIPKAFWNGIYEAARRTSVGDITALAVTRSEAIKKFAHYGVEPKQVYEAMGVVGEADLTMDQVVLLQGMLTALEEKEMTPEAMFPSGQPADSNLANRSIAKIDEIKARHAKPGGTPDPKSQPSESPASSMPASTPGPEATSQAAPAEYELPKQAADAQKELERRRAEHKRQQQETEKKPLASPSLKFEK